MRTGYKYSFFTFRDYTIPSFRLAIMGIFSLNYFLLLLIPVGRIEEGGRWHHPVHSSQTRSVYLILPVSIQQSREVNHWDLTGWPCSLSGSEEIYRQSSPKEFSLSKGGRGSIVHPYCNQSVANLMQPHTLTR